MATVIEILINQLLLKGDKSKVIIENIDNYFNYEHTSSEIDFALNLLLRNDNSLLQFICETCIQNVSKEFYAAEKGLDLILKLIKGFIFQVEKYASNIKDVCVAIMQGIKINSSFKVKAYCVLIELFSVKQLLKKSFFTIEEENEIVEKLFLELSNESKCSPSVLQKIYELWGVLGKSYETAVSPKAAQLLNNIVQKLKNQTNESKENVKLALLTGCINGLNGLLVNFTGDLENDLADISSSRSQTNNYMPIIYECITKLCIYNPENTRKVAHRAALSLLTNHMSLFWDEMFLKYKWWHITLKEWLETQGEDRKAGEAVLSRFQKEVTQHLSQSSKGENIEAFQYFVKYYKDAIVNAETSSQELSLAIKGFGSLSGACSKLMNSKDVEAMFNLVLQRVLQMFKRVDSDKEKEYLPDFIEALSNIVRELEIVSEKQIFSLEQLCIFAISHYPTLLPNRQNQIIRALRIGIINIALNKENNKLESFLSAIVYQGVIRTCSHPTLALQSAELQMSDESMNNIVNYKSYIELWKSLITFENGAVNSDVAPEFMVNVAAKIYDVIIETLIKLIDKLDISIRPKPQDTLSVEMAEDTSDTNFPLELTSIADNIILVNVVELYRELLLPSSRNVVGWISKMSYDIINKAVSFPNTASFYKLLAVVLKCADEQKYFQSYAEDGEIEFTSYYIVKFLEDVLVRLRQYTGDLQVACLEVIMATPVVVLKPLLELIAPTFQAVFNVGRSYLELAHKGMDALERWQKELPAEKLHSIVLDILPSFDPFLRSRVHSKDPDVKIHVPKSYKRHHKSLAEESELSKVQKRMLEFLSHLNTPTCLSLLDHDETTAVSWSSDKFLQVVIPFPDVRPEIYLDDFLPRVVELALSSERATRTVAGELLHAIVMALLAKGKDVERSCSQSLKEVFEHVAPALLRLGSHPDNLTCQLFNPVMLQMTHWLSSKWMLKSVQTSVVLEAVWDGITHPTDTAVRDFSATCLQEFVTWSIKQLTDSDLQHHPLNVKAAIKQINTYCLHPSPYKRFGAALAFNKLYRELRENQSIIDIFWIELFYHFLRNLALSKTEDTQQVLQALDHLERVLVERSGLFNKENNKRRIPVELKGPLLKDLLNWLIEQCTSIHESYRMKCMHLVQKLACCIPECGMVSEFLDGSHMASGDYCGGLGKHFLSSMPLEATIASVILWLKKLISSLDCYAWLVEQGMRPSENLLSSDKSSFYEATKFLLIISLSSATPVMERLRGEIYQHIALSVQEETDFKVAKCKAIVQLLKFVSVKELVKDIPEEFWSTQWWSVVSNCVLTPNKLEFGINNQEVISKLPNIVGQLLTTLYNTLQESHLRNLYAALGNMEATDCQTVCSSLNAVFSGECNVSVDMKNHLKGLVVLHQSGVFSHLEMAKHWKGETILEAVAGEIADSESTIQPNLAALNYGKSLLSFAFLLQTDVTTTLKFVLDTLPLQDCKTFSKVTKGEHFTKLFKDELLGHFLSDPQLQCIDELLNEVDLYKVDFIKLLVSYCEYSPSTAKRPGQKLGRKVSNRWYQLERWAGDDLRLQQTLLDIATGVSKCFRYPNACFKTEDMKPLARWVLSLIATPEAKFPLSFKRDVLILLPCVAKQDTFTDLELMDALKALKATHFPLTFSEFVEGSLEANTYQAAFQQLLIALVQSGNMDILEIIILETRTDANHPCKEDIDRSLLSFIKKLSLEHQTFALNKVFDMFRNERYSEGRLILLHIFMIPLLTYALPSPVAMFFSEIIKWIQNSLEESLEKHDASKAKEQLKFMIGAFSLVGTLFVILDQKQYLCVNSDIVNASGLLTEKEFAKKFLTVAYNVRTFEPHFTDDEYKELFRLYQCSAYKAVISIITNCTWQEELKEKFYRAFIFEETPVRKLWSHIVPTSVPFSFPIDFEELPKRKKQLVEIKKKFVEKHPDEGINSYQSVLGSQSLFTSTLNEDITKYDFTGYSVRTYEDSERVRAEQETTQTLTVELDVDVLNQHECMPLLCGFIRSVTRRSGLLPDSNQDLELPPWMKHLLKPLELATEHKNVKVFILKLILNCEECFRPYAKYCFFPVLDCLLSNCLGDSINYMTTDVIEMLTFWYKIAKLDQNQPESNMNHYKKMQITKFVDFLIEKSPADRRNIFNCNLELIKLVIETWKPQVPYNSILQITTPENGSKNQLYQQNIRIGLTIASKLLANDTLPFEEATKTWYYGALKSNLKDSDKYIYQLCADVIGRLLKKLDKDNDNKLLSEDKSFYDDVYEIIKSNLSSDTRAQYNLGRFVVCLHAVQEHYAPISLRFLANIKIELPSLPCTFRVMMLKCLKTALEAKSWETCPYLDLMHPVFTNFLTYDEDTKEITLNILYKMLPMLTEADAEIIVQHVITLSEHAKSPCRYVIYDIVASYYDRRLARGDRSSLIVTTCKEILIRGLVDNDPALKEKMYKFWNEDGRLSNTTTDRFVDVMSALYSPKEEYHFLSSAVTLLLEPAVANPFCAEAKVFSTPLSDCKYEDYNLMADWRTQNAFLAPMFAQTLSSINISFSSQNQHSFNIRATPTSFAFTPTVRSQDDIDSSSTLSSTPSASSSFLPSASLQSSKWSARSNLGSEVDVFNKPKRRRILRNKEQVSRSMADLNIRRNVRREKTMAERRQRRDAEVSIVRSYRRGDFPDVEIKYADLVKPLQLLLQRDLVMARQVFLSLYNGLRAQSINIPNLPSAVSNILETSTQFEPSTMGTMLDVVLTKPNEFPVKYDTITKVCKNSKLLSLGSLLIERLLLGADDTQPPVDKRSKPGSSLKRTNNLWIQLAEMYRCMGEMDVVKGIFEDKMASTCGTLVQEALQDESIGNWRGAQQKYTEAIIKAGSSVMQDFLYEACFTCCEYMSDWKGLNTIIRKQVNNDLNEIWYDSWTLDHYLPGLMSSEINIALTENFHSTEFLQTVHDWMSDPVKEDHMKSRLGEYLCMVYLLRDDGKRCRLYSDNNLSQFIDNWSQLDVLQRKLRVQKLLQLQSMMEIHHYISLPTAHSKRNSKIKELLRHWTNNSPSNLDSLNNWETRTLYRHFFTRKLQENCEVSASVVEDAHTQSQLASLLDCAIQQENYYVARKYIGLIHSQATGSEVEENFQLLYSKVKFLQARLEQDNIAIFKMTIDATNELRDVLNVVDTLSPSLKMKLYNHVAVLCSFLKTAVENEPSVLTNFRPDYGFQNFIGLKGIFSPAEVKSHLHQKILCSLQKAVDIAEEITTDGSSYSDLAGTYCELAKYSFQGEDINESVVIEALLKAMEFGSREAQQLFPKLLQLNTLSTTNAQLFREKSDRVPEWMLLQWLPQLLSSLDSTTGDVLGPLLERIARAYPAALQIPFQLSCEMYQNGSNKPQQHIIARLKSLLIQSPTMIALVDALTCLHFRPISILSYHLRRLKQDIESNADESFTYEMLKKESFLTAQDINKVKGSLFQKNNKYEERIEQVVTTLKSNKTRAISELNQILRDVQQEEEKEDTRSKNLLLKTYSPFLDSFNQDRHGDIEIPGQYTGHSRPIPEQHVMIAGFKSQIQIMDSLRRPIRITIIGNDAKERHYLVKFGEDLRQDQRVQQLFDVMNQLLATDPDTATRGLFVDTYTVVPLNTRSGLIAWVSDTVSLRDVIVKSEIEKYKEARKEYRQFICGPNKGSLVQVFSTAFKVYKKLETIQNFKRVKNLLPSDLLRKAVHKMASNSEAYVYLRSQMLTSHAVLCICNWLLGIGDRHLDNILMSTKTGRFVGIDFGHAFDTAVGLPIPELMPFRMTPQIVNLAAPLYLKGTLQETMVHTLHSLRTNNQVLLNTMYVFIQEPSINWLTSTHRYKPEEGIEGLVEEHWYPREKIKLAGRKLQGDHPSYIMLAELEMSQRKHPCLQQLVQLVKGDEDSLRSSMAQQGLTAREQVQCLLDQATDEHILGKTYFGWDPFV